MLQEGERVTLLALGSMVEVARQVAQRLKDEKNITATNKILPALSARPHHAKSDHKPAAKR